MTEECYILTPIEIDNVEFDSIDDASLYFGVIDDEVYMTVEEDSVRDLIIGDELELYLEVDNSLSVTDDYRVLKNKPSINDVILIDNKTFPELGLIPMTNGDIDDLFGKF